MLRRWLQNGDLISYHGKGKQCKCDACLCDIAAGSPRVRRVSRVAVGYGRGYGANAVYHPNCLGVHGFHQMSRLKAIDARYNLKPGIWNAFTGTRVGNLRVIASVKVNNKDVKGVWAGGIPVEVCEITTLPMANLVYGNIQSSYVIFEKEGIQTVDSIGPFTVGQTVTTVVSLQISTALKWAIGRTL